MKFRLDLKKAHLLKAFRLHRRTLFAYSLVAQLLCSIGTFVGICKKQKGTARVFAFFGGVCALLGLAALADNEREQRRGTGVSEEESLRDGRSGGFDDEADDGGFSPAMRFPAVKSTVQSLFTDEKASFPEVKNTEERKRSGEKEKKTVEIAGTKDDMPPSNGGVTVLLPDLSEEEEKRREAERLEKERAAEEKREEENRKARERLDEAIRILKNAAEGTPTDDRENDLEKELAERDE